MEKEQDLRVQKTRKAFISAFNGLLNRHNFNQITINELCEEAGISRATFYSHFNDKYDLLKYWLNATKREIVVNVYNYKELEDNVNQFIIKNRKIISNIMKGANREVLDLINDFMRSVLSLTLKRKIRQTTGKNDIVLTNFCVGGLTNLLLWQVENNFPPNLCMMNQYLYNMLDILTTWDATQETQEVNEE